MSSRFIDLVAGSRERWPLAGDQLYVDLDLSVDNLPAGRRLRGRNARVVESGTVRPGDKVERV